MYKTLPGLMCVCAKDYQMVMKWKNKYETVFIVIDIVSFCWISLERKMRDLKLYCAHK